MKIDKDTLARMKVEVDRYMAANPDTIKNYEAGNFFRSKNVNDLNVRFRFDVFYAAVSPTEVGRELANNREVNDNHIHTAMKSLLPTITRRY